MSYTTTTVLTVSSADEVRQALMEEIQSRIDAERVAYSAKRRPNNLQSHGHHMRHKVLTDLLTFLDELKIEEKRDEV